MADILKIIFQIIHNTPFWVWLVLLILIKRGSALLAESQVSLGRSCIMPAVFIIWGLDTIVNRFGNPNVLLNFYVVSLIPGFFLSYFLYRNKKFYIRNTVLVCEGSIIPLVIMLLNFLVKYTLNVLLATRPMLYNDFQFNILYGCICGFTIGLFFGGIYKTIQAKKQLFGRKK
ncbi:DUF6622 family protein [Liquorilactobacillus mali]|uniref:DUF1453 domain-containing protein n=1 Tax=Liquorilactobacillus mali KCTC 3596 = DSM 20444 TaxID=1046596 RepID=J0KYS7_9LACO|nr:DUF6622 family protein [Liquorilactobacillus mali]EJE99372.1 hypothetical protein LMA_05706 [Liquorilactobacillus mali KCTC 3596 = DSM 20444]KRN09312.1 hypothetical protein FD00_GL001138 [Liquorilactobacillus mali KCTC 3596 = DSM 20444]MDC7952624.1 DUF1453 domain-containing protein [Liquorilactobacillus mali]MDV7758666.1 DUF1453 domain-containing protein [Liquorilactobacillus mali]QFQ74685.1 DUF1453 domain-containing protein [Liquorilactobacillus mali]